MKRQDEIEGAVDVKLVDWQAAKGIWPSPLRTQTGCEHCGIRRRALPEKRVAQAVKTNVNTNSQMNPVSICLVLSATRTWQGLSKQGKRRVNYANRSLNWYEIMK